MAVTAFFQAATRVADWQVESGFEQLSLDRRGNVASDVAEHSGSIKRRHLFQSGTARVASTNLAPVGVIWHLSGKVGEVMRAPRPWRAG